MDWQWFGGLEAHGILAGAFTTVALWPQARRLGKLKSAREISWWAWGLLAPGCALWAVYGIRHNSDPLFWTQVPTILLTWAIIVQKMRFGGSHTVGVGSIVLTGLLPVVVVGGGASTETIGTVAGFLTTTSLIPQIARILRLGSAKEISPGFLGVFAFGVMLWGAHGLRLHAPAQFWTQVFTETLVLTLAGLRIKYGHVPRGYTITLTDAYRATLALASSWGNRPR